MKEGILPGKIKRGKIKKSEETAWKKEIMLF